MVLSIFGVRLVQLQGLDPKAYAARAAASGMVSATLPANRGEIVDRNGVPLAESVSGSMIVADPTRTAPHAAAIAKIMADRLHLDYFDLLTTLSKPNTRFQYVARRVPSTTATTLVDQLTNAGYQGLATRRDPLRSYPGADVGANLIGFMDGEGAPAAGLEATFNKMLKGTDGSETYEVGGGNRIPLGDNSTVNPVNGKNLHLTIDRDVQWYAQRLLRTKVHQANADSGAAVVLDTRTGEILGLADYPTFDANHGNQASQGDWGSRALSDVYEPGSVEKVLTMSALIDQGLVNPLTRIVVPQQLPVLDRVIHDYFQHGRIRLTLAGVIAKSSNIGTTLASMGIAPAVMDSYLRKFGLGARADIGMPGESNGLLSPGSTWSKLTKAEISFGQGLSVNALQMAAAVNTIANHGQYVSPSLIQGRATTSGGVTVGTGVAARRQVVTPQTAAKVARMMEMVTTEGSGTAPGAKVPGYRTAGKTGTAQEVGAKCRCYDGSLDVSFAGFAPADKPRFTVYVVVKNPKMANAGGGLVAGPVFRRLMSYVLEKYAVPPTETRPAALPVEW
jgi:cell division protein FtsI (penicillin-binding protein 3)